MGITKMNKPSLYLLPGLLCSQSVWRHQEEALSDTFEIRIPDYRNCNSMQAMADFVLKDAPGSFFVAGHSMGGRVALQLMLQCPERVSKLALLGTSPYPASSIEHEMRTSWVEMVKEGGMSALHDTWPPLMLHPDRLGDEALVSDMIKMVKNFSPDQFTAEVEALLSRPDYRPILESIQCPTLIICGEQDGLNGISIHEEMLHKIPNAKMEIIENCGHMLMIERPEPVTKAMRAFFTE